MNIKGFLVTALTSALDLGIATCDDVLRHVTPDILAAHLPRPLWARLLTACVGAPRVDAQLVVETIGVPNLCEHVPSTIMWVVLDEIGARSLGGAFVPRPVAATHVAYVATPVAVAPPTPAPVVEPRTPLTMAPPPEVIAPPLPVTATQPSPTVAMGPDIPSPALVAADLFDDVIAEERPAGGPRARTPTQQRFRASSTGIGRLAASSRRPQASASAPPQFADDRDGRRAATESEFDAATNVAGRAATGTPPASAPATPTTPANDDWKANLAVEDEQLVDWAGSDETVTGTQDVVEGNPRKR
ncbi:MAG: hypothetical protein NT062_09065 [Proteobacteria bacterium]|nr:hypothetical protein [Pseudomonadota bacterium]